MTRRQTERTIACLGALTAVNAAAGALYGLSGAPSVPREWLEGSRFRNYRVPSAFLGVVVGGSAAASAAAAWRGGDRAGALSLASGAILTGWIAAQVATIGPRSVLQPLMAGVGLTMIGLGIELRRSPAGAPAPAPPQAA